MNTMVLYIYEWYYWHYILLRIIYIWVVPPLQKQPRLGDESGVDPKQFDSCTFGGAPKGDVNVGLLKPITLW